MFKSKFNELMKSESSSFEIINDAEALSVEGGAACRVLKSCDTYTGNCNNLETCGTYATEGISPNPTPIGGVGVTPQLPSPGGGN